MRCKMNEIGGEDKGGKPRKVRDLVRYFDSIYNELEAGKRRVCLNKQTADKTNSTKKNSFTPNKCGMIIEELLKTEETYFQTLRHIIGNYVFHFKKEIDENIFKHLEDLGKYQLMFYVDLLDSKGDCEKIAYCFLKHKQLFHQYKIYIGDMYDLFEILSKKYNKFVKDRRKQLGDNFRLEDQLLTPFQRLTRYILLLRNLQGQINDRNNIIKEAITYLESVALELNLST